MWSTGYALCTGEELGAARVWLWPTTSGIDEFGWREVRGMAPIACAFIRLTPDVSGLSDGKT